MRPDRAIRVAVIDHTAALSGAEISLSRFVPLLDRAQVETVVVVFADGPLVARLEADDVTVRVLPLAPRVSSLGREQVGRMSIASMRTALGAVVHVVRLARLLRNLQVDVILTNSLKSDVIAGVAGRLIRRPVIWYVRDRIAPDYLPDRVVRLFRLLARVLPTFVIANSEATRHTLGTAAQTRSAVVHPGLPSAAFEPVRPRRMSETVTVGMVGRISPTKGQDVFLRAAAAVHQTHPEVHFSVVGSSLFNEAAYERHIHDLCTELGLERILEFTGQVADPSLRLRDFAILVHASPVPEPFGQVVIEGMAAGVPVIATRGGGIDDIAGALPDQYLILTEPGESDQLAAAIRRLLDDRTLSDDLADRAFAYAQRSFMAIDTARRVTRILADVVNG